MRRRRRTRRTRRRHRQTRTRVNIPLSIHTTIAARAVKLSELLATWGHCRVVGVVGGLPALVAETLKSQCIYYMTSLKRTF
jgi:hypothetical protein